MITYPCGCVAEWDSRIGSFVITVFCSTHAEEHTHYIDNIYNSLSLDDE